MSYQYDDYLKEHIANVGKGLTWLDENLPETTKCLFNYTRYEITQRHDASKFEAEEYSAYDEYFYGNNRSHQVVENFNKAWLHHIHNNKHHWQHWVLINDDETDGTIALEMPYRYVIEMICDWWTFSWKTGNLSEIFDWYEKHKQRIIFHPKTRIEVEGILSQMKTKLEESTDDQLQM